MMLANAHTPHEPDIASSSTEHDEANSGGSLSMFNARGAQNDISDEEDEMVVSANVDEFRPSRGNKRSKSPSALFRRIFGTPSNSAKRVVQASSSASPSRSKRVRVTNSSSCS